VKILVACEFSGIVRDAFRRRGHQVVSIDLLPSERLGPHVIGDARTQLNAGWDMLIAFPPCTHLARSGARWYHGTTEMYDALYFVCEFLNAPIPRICVENPIGAINSYVGKPEQIIQPWMFGHGETKATCLWLEGLPNLVPTDIVSGREARVHRAAPGENRWKERSRTLTGIAEAMASQWA
jgi:hypothetical protein